jgi:hypothetical protein
MLCALTTPSPEDLTDLGDIVPLMVLINFILGSVETTSPCAGNAMAQSEATKIRARKRLRIRQLY